MIFNKFKQMINVMIFVKIMLMKIKIKFVLMEN